MVRLRTNFRHGEEVFLFHTRATPEQSRVIFLDYLARANRMREHPEWYNAITNNCTTNIVPFVADARNAKQPFDYRILLNGKADEMMYERGDLATDNLPLAELRRKPTSMPPHGPPAMTQIFPAVSEPDILGFQI